jgi:hypothetical protein
MKSNLLPIAARVESWLGRYGAWALAGFALVYYGLYYNCDLPLTGEAGSNALIAQRIREGWLPIKDMFVGYNLMWFYPLAGIFEITGPHLLATRIFFLGLSMVTGLLGFVLVRRATGMAWLAALAGGLMVLMPGAIYRNYMGFLATLAAFALVRGYVVDAGTPRARWLWMGFAGAALSLCFSIRIEPSLLLAVVWAGLVVLYPLGVRGEFVSRLKILLPGTLLALVCFAAVHAPLVVDASRRGFGKEFLAQYSQFVNLLRWELSQEIEKAFPPKPASPSAKFRDFDLIPASLNKPVEPKAESARDGRRARPELKEVLRVRGVSYLDLAIYLPVLSAGVLALSGAGMFFGGIARGNREGRKAGLVLLTTTGCSLALFPQYFFFRPDSVHLAEFMVPFYAALACGLGFGLGLFRNRSLTVRVAGVLLAAVCVVQIVVAFNALFGREGSGSIRSARGKTALFEAPGGISMRVRPSDLADWQNLRDTLLRHSEPGDWLVTYPYVPVLNILAERPSYQRKLYVDNATESVNFPFLAIAEFDQKRPAVVVINNRNINKTEFSRFKNWAAPFYDHIASNYVLAGTYLKEIEVFVRPDRIPGNSP